MAHGRRWLKNSLGSFFCAFLATALHAQTPLLLPEPVVAALAGELSGDTAKRNLEFLTRLHRMRGSREYRAAADFLVEQLKAYGIADAHIEQFPVDGKIFYGTQKSRPAWDAEFAELWEMRDGETGLTPQTRLASFEAMPVSLAQDSESADVTAALVDVGEGTKAEDYQNKDVKGKLVLAGAQPGAVARLAVERYGAAGIVSYAQNQRTAWWKENDNLVRWGHLDSFAPSTFAFMISLKQARALQQRLAHGEPIRLHAVVRASRHAGSYDVVTATVPGADPKLKQEEIAFSCHLDHQRPGANDNASGCVTILEVARTFSKLIREGRIQRPARTLRFIWPPEIEGTLALLNAKPEWAARIKAVVHMDMVGGGPETKAIFHVTRGPASLPSFVNDVAASFAEFVNEQSAKFADSGEAAYPLNAAEGGKEALQAAVQSGFSMGSDHVVYTDSSFGIPAIYFCDAPDRYIHTNLDSVSNIDATKLLRAGFIGAASGYFLAGVGSGDARAIWQVMQAESLRRTAQMLEYRAQLNPAEAAALGRFHLWQERALVGSMERFFRIPDSVRAESASYFSVLDKLVQPAKAPAPAGDGRQVFRRNTRIKGPMAVFGSDYFKDHYGEQRTSAIRLLRFQGLRGSGEAYAYEVLNFADGHHTAQEIRDLVSAVYGPVPLDIVVEYLRALQSIDVVSEVS